MRTFSGLLLAACLFAATSAMAGNLTFENDAPVWHPAKCTKPVPPESVVNADSETPGDKMNALIGAYNTYASAAQAYMNCISKEADADQHSIGQAITSGAKAEIDAVIAETEKLAIPLRAAKQ